MNNRCLAMVDLGDGVTLICGREHGHDGPHDVGDVRAQGSECGVHGCLRVGGHHGPHKTARSIAGAEDDPLPW
jgi:hypothetical protein